MKTPENAPDNNVGRKTPEEIKKGLCCCVTEIAGCKGCPFDNSSDDGLVWECTVDSSALAYIQQLESRLAQAERERDALLCDLKLVGCAMCKHIGCRAGDIPNECFDCVNACNFEWRGVPENTKEEA